MLNRLICWLLGHTENYRLADWFKSETGQVLFVGRKDLEQAKLGIDWSFIERPDFGICARCGRVR